MKTRAMRTTKRELHETRRPKVARVRDLRRKGRKGRRLRVLSGRVAA